MTLLSLLLSLIDARTCCLPAPQVMEKNLLLIMIIMLEELQSKPVVCVQLFFWNVLDLLR